MDKWVCPRCGKANPEVASGAGSCAHCGAVVDEREMIAGEIRWWTRGSRPAMVLFAVLIVGGIVATVMIFRHNKASLAERRSRSILPGWTKEPLAAHRRRQAARKAEDPLAGAAERAICSNSLLECYDQHDARGNISGRIVVDLDGGGRATAARFERGDAPDAVKQCMIAAARRRSVPGFSGGSAQVRCEYAGTYMGASSSIYWNAGFVRRTAAPVVAPAGPSKPRPAER